ARLRLGGEVRHVTVLFADVCGFTQILDKISPEKTVALLNELFTVATEIVQKRGGIIDKFVGDAVMGGWGAPEGRPDDAERAGRGGGGAPRTPGAGGGGPPTAAGGRSTASRCSSRSGSTPARPSPATSAARSAWSTP